MNILIAPDKFKGSLTATQVCDAIKHALLQLQPALTVQSIPLADGGEGTADLLTHPTGKRVTCLVHDPLFRKINVGYGISGDGSTAFIEMANASGLQLLKIGEKNPLKTTTVGTGELIADAINRGVRKIVLAIGGSATNDAGLGMATALGYKFYDAQNQEILPVGENLIALQRVDATEVNQQLKQTKIVVLCDVSNPLSGPTGTAFVYGPQKGASEQDALKLDKGLQHFANVVHAQLGISTDFAGAGAAGGLGAGAKVFLNAMLQRGIDYVMETLQVEAAIRNADLVITGEGKMDPQTLSGKVVAGVAAMAVRLHKPVLAIVGINKLPESGWKQMGISHVISLVNENTSVETAVQQAQYLIEKRIAEHLRLETYIRSNK